MEILEMKVGTGEIITIKYHGGSQPGAIREIVPTKISYEKNQVMAYCYSTKKPVKSFSIDKIEIIDEKQIADTGFEYVDYKAPTLEEIYKTHKEDWENAEWHAVYKAQSIELYKKTKNGNFLKKPTVSIQYDDTIVNKQFIFVEGEEHVYTEIQDAKRPWKVIDGGKSTRFSNYNNAIAGFLEASK